MGADWRCKDEKFAKEQEFAGILNEKYRNKWMSNIKTIEISSDTSTFKSTFMRNDVSGIFDKLNIGDSLIKKSGNLNVQVYRDDNLLFEKALVYNCN